MSTTPVRIKARPDSQGYIYGTIEERRKAGAKCVLVYFELPSVSPRSLYELDELEEVTATKESTR